MADGMAVQRRRERERYSVRVRYDRLQPFVGPQWEPGLYQYVIGE
jgi:hypothetical protein